MKKLSVFLMLAVSMMMASYCAFAQEVTITLDPGWTWISYPRCDSMATGVALQSIPPRPQDMVKSQTNSALYLGGQWRGGMQQLVPGLGLMYMSNRQESVTFVIPANVVSSTEIVLNPGWTWVSYPRVDTLNITEALQSIVPKTGDMIKSQSSSAVFMNGHWYGGLQQLIPGKGLMYKSGRQEDVSFIFGAPSIPTVVTNPVAEILQTTATAYGEVTNDGGSTVAERGICWSLEQEPDMDDNVINCGSGTGSFTASLTGMTPETTYYVRSYAINDLGLAYGDEVSFTTLRVFTVPEVMTADVMGITPNTAVGGGEVTDDGGTPVTERGICWSLNSEPTIDDNYASSGEGMGSYTVAMSELTELTTYYVRAYAINEVGISYGEEVSFTTTESIVVPEGAIAGLFSVSDTLQVFFSQGNLQYQASTNTWRFAENQYDFVGLNNNRISETYDGWIDLFGWGTSGYAHGAVCYQPWSTSTVETSYKAYGNVNYDLYDQTGQADWGYNAISNGGNEENLWRTMTNEEWNYVLNTRTTASGIRFAKATVNDVKGLVLLPDNWNSATYTLNSTNNAGRVEYNVNVISASDWVTLQDAGAVFIPAAGSRYDKTVSGYSDTNSQSASGYYWTSLHDSSDGAYDINFIRFGVMTNVTHYRYMGLSVRVVHPVE